MRLIVSEVYTNPGEPALVHSLALRAEDKADAETLTKMRDAYAAGLIVGVNDGSGTYGFLDRARPGRKVTPHTDTPR